MGILTNKLALLEILEDMVKINVNEHWEKREGISLLTYVFPATHIN